MSEELKAAQARIACLEGEIAKRDARIVELDKKYGWALSELSAIKAQGPVVDEQAAFEDWITRVYPGGDCSSVTEQWLASSDYADLYAAPVSESKAQGSMLQKIGKRLAELLDEDQFAEVEQMLASLNAAPVQQPKCKTCNDNGRIGGPSFYAPDEGGEPCPDCSAPAQQVGVPDERAAFEREDRYIVIKRSDMDRIPNQKVVHSFLGALGELSAHSVRIPQRKFLVIESDWPEYDPAWKLIQDRVQGRPILDAAPAAPAADAGLVDMYRHLQTVTPYRFKKIQDASVTDGGDVLYFHKDRFDAALLDDIAAHRAKGVV